MESDQRLIKQLRRAQNALTRAGTMLFLRDESDTSTAHSIRDAMAATEAAMADFAGAIPFDDEDE